MRGLTTSVVSTLFIVACAASPRATERPTPRPTDPPTPEPGYSDAEKERLVRENIEILYEDAPWQPYLLFDGGEPAVVADGTTLFVFVHATIPLDLADSM